MMGKFREEANFYRLFSCILLMLDAAKLLSCFPGDEFSLSLFFKRSHSRLEKEKETRVSLIMIHIIRLEYFVSFAY